jgi:methylthioribose-1-phosphate isomerase
LPARAGYIDYTDATSVADAIAGMVVRGAPAIGITAAYGVVLAARAAYTRDPACWRDLMQTELQKLAQSRPTAVNLRWALDRMQSLCAGIDGAPEQALLKEAQAIHAEDIAANRHMGALGAPLIANARAVLTHCNTGSLATGGFGTALGVIRTAYQHGTLSRVYADETRPWLQGARLTAWELQQDGIPVTLIADSAATWLLRRGEVQWVIVGADRIAANGDVANKIGTYGLAVAARHHGVKFMVVAPTSTFDCNTRSGADIHIEDRGPAEITHFADKQTAPAGISVWNPVFDITPAELVDVIVTEKGVISQPDVNKMVVLQNLGK